MKRVVLIRHAKASLGEMSTKDFDRTLTDRGQRDANFLAKMLKEKIENLDLIICSPAIRAKTTAEYFAKEYFYPKENITFDIEIYKEGQKSILSNFAKLDEKVETVLIFGHNPDITSTASYLAGERVDNIPTCGIISILFDFDSWRDIRDVNGKIEFFLYPKLYFKEIDFD